MPNTNNRSYPRGIPFRQSVNQPQAAPRSRILPLGLGALALVVVTAAGTMLLLNLTASRPQAAAPSDDSPPAETRKPESKPSKVAPLAKSERERYLAALGLLSAAQVYQTYLNIGLLADGVESGAYSKAEAEEMLATVAGLLNQMDRQLDKISDTGLDAEDQQNVERIQTLTVLLRRQASALRAYWATGEREQIDRYHQTRETSWKHLSAVLDIE
jgi:hypothetical protein